MIGGRRQTEEVGSLSKNAVFRRLDPCPAVSVKREVAVPSVSSQDSARCMDRIVMNASVVKSGHGYQSIAAGGLGVA